MNTRYENYNEEMAFKGNSNLKPVNTVINFTKEQTEEYFKCYKDWKYFIESYHKVVTLDEGVTKIKLRDYQLELIRNFIEHRFNITLACRQAGKTESYVCFVLWYILFNKDKSVVILANKLRTTKGILRKIKQSFELLPKFLQQGVKTWNATEIILENGSSVYAGATTSSSVRSGSANVVIIDEMAFINNSAWLEFYDSTYPVLSSSKQSKLILVSTPCGMNHFYKFWTDAINKKNEFHHSRVDWWQVPGRDEKWKEETIRNTSQISFNQEFGNSFLGSIQTLIEAEILVQQKHSYPIDEPKLFSSIGKDIHKYLKIYEEPKKNHVYTLGIDSSKMTEESSGDSLAMCVLDVTNWPIKQVAVFFAKDGISYLRTPEIAVKLGSYYNEAYMFVENNDIGQEVANMCLFDLEYENIFIEKGSLPGYRTTTKTKRIGCENLKLLIENGKIELNDFDTISQLSTFVRSKKSYKAESGYQDDLVLAVIASIFFMQSKGLDIDIAEDNLTLVKNILAKTTEEQKIQEEEDAPATFFLDTGDDADLDDADWGNLNF